MSTPTLLGRPPERSSEILDELRGRITQGHLAPGVQLPTRVQIEQHFGASPGTVQRALQELQREGFVTVNGRQGTFVSHTPPHLTNYALIFPSLPSEAGWNRFFAALDHEAPGIAQTLGRKISVYYGAGSSFNHEDLNRLLADVKAQRLGGIIFAALPEPLMGTPIMEDPKVPRVAIMAPSAQYKIHQVNPDRETMWERSTDFFMGHGRRNLALLLSPHKAFEIEGFQQKMVARGFNTPARWVQCAPREFPEVARNLTQLLFESDGARPDAFFITDDNLVEDALAGLSAAGVRVPEDVEVVVHCNFPHTVPASVPVRRLGFDARRVLQACFDDLDAQRAGRKGRAVTAISAQFEEEIAALRTGG